MDEQADEKDKERERETYGSKLTNVSTSLEKVEHPSTTSCGETRASLTSVEKPAMEKQVGERSAVQRREPL